MTWADTLRKAEGRLKKSDATGAFLGAFGALESCYRIVAREDGWRPRTREENGFRPALDWLRERGGISESDHALAAHLGFARNVVAHGYGFEPSLGQAQRTIADVKRLCSKFGRTVADVMTSPVITAHPEQTVGEFVRHMVEDGISQFPVVDRGQVVGTLTDASVLGAWEEGGGILDPRTPVRDLMYDRVLPSVPADTTLEEARRCLEKAKAEALLVLTSSGLTGIVTKYDLLRCLEV